MAVMPGVGATKVATLVLAGRLFRNCEDAYRKNRRLWVFAKNSKSKTALKQEGVVSVCDLLVATLS